MQPPEPQPQQPTPPPPPPPPPPPVQTSQALPSSPCPNVHVPQECGRNSTQMPSPSAPPPSSYPNGRARSPVDVSVGYPPPPNLNVNQVTTTAEWSTGLCACHFDVANCCISLFCPCITFGQISEIIDKGTSSCAINGAIYALLAIVLGCACFYSAIYRRRMRYQFNLKGSNLEDCCIHSCCEICALSQEYRQLQLLGFDLGLGWHANIDRHNQGATTVPPPHESMRR